LLVQESRQQSKLVARKPIELCRVFGSPLEHLTTRYSTFIAPSSRASKLSSTTMLAETELNKLEGQLANFNISTKARQDALEELTLSYGQLLEDYRTLRSDYEEEKESREKYKKLARGQERNPFVLVLVDADGYVVSL
jgi:Asp-tRNA(Asn)/Glu-tRNA(Gln) amidotransferase C subunit